MLNPLNGQRFFLHLLIGACNFIDGPFHRLLSHAIVEFDLAGATIRPVEQENHTEDDERDKQNVPSNIETITSLTNAQLEELTKEWMLSMQKLLLMYKHRDPTDDSPISEFELWQTQETEFKNMLENMRHPFVADVQGM